MTSKISPLDDRHRVLDAKMTPFGGWEMPLSYPSGTLDEHRACRQAAVVFDVSHLGTVRVRGGGAYDRLQRAFTNDLGRIEPGRAQYTHLCADDGSVLDDIIVWWLDDTRFHVMPNASNTERVRSAVAGSDVTVTDIGADNVEVTATHNISGLLGPVLRSFSGGSDINMVFTLEATVTMRAL